METIIYIEEGYDYDCGRVKTNIKYYIDYNVVNKIYQDCIDKYNYETYRDDFNNDIKVKFGFYNFYDGEILYDKHSRCYIKFGFIKIEKEENN